MNNNDEREKEFLQLKEEAELIKKEIENDPSLDDVKTTAEMDAQMEKLIRTLRSEDEEQETLRSPEEVRIYRVNKKALLVAALVAVLLLGFGMTCMGSQNILKIFTNQGNEEKGLIQIDTDDEMRREEISDVDMAYDKIEETYDTPVVRPIYMPEESKYIECQIDENEHLAYIVYDYQDQLFMYEIFATGNESSFGYVTDETLVETELLEVSGVEITINCYEKKENEEILREAVFEYKECNYVLSGNVEEAEFEKILKNLHFF